jgi:ubiquitin-conjugating enzyme E2 J2
MQREPPPFIWAAPDEKNILNCTLCHPNLRPLTELISEYRELPDRELPATVTDPNFERSHPEASQRGPPDSPFEGGEYHGVLMFPPEYPFKPPGIKVRSSDQPHDSFTHQFLPDAHTLWTLRT